MQVIDSLLFSQVELSRRLFYLVSLVVLAEIKSLGPSFVELKEPPLFTTLWILDPNSGPSVIQNGPIVRVEQTGFRAERNRYLQRKEFLS